MEGPGTLAALTPGDAGEAPTLQRAAFVTKAQADRELHIPPMAQTLAGLRVELGEQCCHRWVTREPGRLVACVRACVGGQGHATEVDARQLVHVAKAWTHWSAATSFWPGRS